MITSSLANIVLYNCLFQKTSADHTSFFILMGVAPPTPLNIMYNSAQSLENYLRITALHFIEQFFLCIRDYEFLNKISTARLPYSSLWYYPFYVINTV